MKALPEKFAERMKFLLGDDFDNYIKSLEDNPVRAFRVNTDKISVEDFLKINPFVTEKIPYVENGFYFQRLARVKNANSYYQKLCSLAGKGNGRFYGAK